jgi:hypothetical protein
MLTRGTVISRTLFGMNSYSITMKKGLYFIDEEIKAHIDDTDLAE